MLLKVLVSACLVVLAVAAYGSAPLIAAWQIREAVRTGDTATLKAKVDWQSVRQSLKSSLGETRKALEELSDAADLPKPGVWQRLKAVVLPYLADPLIDRYVTADGAPKLYAWRQAWRQRIGKTGTAGNRRAAETAPAEPGWLAGTSLGRTFAHVRRIERWSFVSPFRLEIELADRVVAGRRWFAALEMRSLAWQLTEMKVLASPPPTPPSRTTRAGRAP